MSSVNFEIMDPVTAAGRYLLHHEMHLPESELPPLLPSMVIEGLPPMRQSMYLPEAEKLVMTYVERWQIVSLDSFFLLGLSLTGFIHSGVISVDRLVAMAILYGILFVLDDLFIDSPNDILLGQYGIAPSIRNSPDQIKEYLDKVLNEIFGQKSKPLPSLANPVEMIFWEVGHDIQRLSNAEWFNTFVEGINEWFQASISSHADIVSGHNLCVQDLRSYSRMRAGNFGGTFIQLLQEFASDCYLTEEMRSLPFMLEAKSAATMHMAFVNDIYSYHKESMQEENPRNLITVLMESEEKTFVQAVHAAIGLANLHARTILDLELKTSNSAVQRHLQGLKELIAGQLYYSTVQKRYRHPDSFFPELRDVIASPPVASHSTNGESPGQALLTYNALAGVPLPIGQTVRVPGP
ncbi:hypothetical protein M758_12G026700 [Ceratodon purpureus]|nr:hypothetical protein M758_12G026700 [Ceratodon purpureus]